MTTAINTHAPTAPAKRGTWGRVALLVLLLAVAGGGFAAWRTLKNGANAAGHTTVATEGSASEPSSDTAVPVEVTRLSKGGIMRTSRQIGSVHAYERADLYAKISGYLDKLLVNYGDKVKKGQLLAVIDDPEILADAEKAKADVTQAKAAVEQAKQFIKAAEAEHKATAAAVDQAKAEVDRYAAMRSYHKKKLDRYKELVVKSAIPQEIADEEQESYDSAVANENASRKTVLKTEADLIASAARVKKAEADLEEAKASQAVAEAKKVRADVFVAYTQILSPYDGVITKRNFFRGAFIRSAADGGTDPLLSVAYVDKVFVVTDIPDRDVPFTDVGDAAEITLDALGTQVFKGKVSRFADAEDKDSRTMHTEIDLPNPDGRLKPGMYGVAKVFLGVDMVASTIPSKCLVGASQGGKADVLIVKDGKAKKTRVEVGTDDGLRVEIRQGLTPQDDVIVSIGSVTDGTPVQPTQAGTQVKAAQAGD